MKTRSLYLTWTWNGTGTLLTPRRTPRQNYQS